MSGRTDRGSRRADSCVRRLPSRRGERRVFALSVHRPIPETPHVPSPGRPAPRPDPPAARPRARRPGRRGRSGARPARPRRRRRPVGRARRRRAVHGRGRPGAPAGRRPRARRPARAVRAAGRGGDAPEADRRRDERGAVVHHPRGGAHRAHGRHREHLGPAGAEPDPRPEPRLRGLAGQRGARGEHADQLLPGAEPAVRQHGDVVHDAGHHAHVLVADEPHVRQPGERGRAQGDRLPAVGPLPQRVGGQDDRRRLGRRRRLRHVPRHGAAGARRDRHPRRRLRLELHALRQRLHAPALERRRQDHEPRGRPLAQPPAHVPRRLFAHQRQRRRHPRGAGEPQRLPHDQPDELHGGERPDRELHGLHQRPVPLRLHGRSECAHADRDRRASLAPRQRAEPAVHRLLERVRSADRVLDRPALRRERDHRHDDVLGQHVRLVVPGRDPVVVVQSDGDRDLPRPGRVPGDAHRDPGGERGDEHRLGVRHGVHGDPEPLHQLDVRIEHVGVVRDRHTGPRGRAHPGCDGGVDDGVGRGGKPALLLRRCARDHQHERRHAQRQRTPVRRQLAQRRDHHPASGLGDAALPVHDPHVGRRAAARSLQLQRRRHGLEQRPGRHPGRTEEPRHPRARGASAHARGGDGDPPLQRRRLVGDHARRGYGFGQDVRHARHHSRARRDGDLQRRDGHRLHPRGFAHAQRRGNAHRRRQHRLQGDRGVALQPRDRRDHHGAGPGQRGGLRRRRAQPRRQAPVLRLLHRRRVRRAPARAGHGADAGADHQRAVRDQAGAGRQDLHRRRHGAGAPHRQPPEQLQHQRPERVRAQPAVGAPAAGDLGDAVRVAAEHGRRLRGQRAAGGLLGDRVGLPDGELRLVELRRALRLELRRLLGWQRPGGVAHLRRAGHVHGHADGDRSEPAGEDDDRHRRPATGVDRRRQHRRAPWRRTTR